MTFEERRRLVLLSFGTFTTLLLVMALLWRNVVGQLFVWLFSDSLGALLVLMVVGSLWTLRAQRRMALAAMRRPASGSGVVGHFSSPGRAILGRLMTLVFLAALFVLWASSR